MFTLKNDNGWDLSRIGAHFGKSKTWASQGLTRYSPESLSPNITQKRGRKKKTDKVDDGVMVGLGKHFHKDSYAKLTQVLNDENIRPISQKVSIGTVFRRCKEAGARSVKPIPHQLTKQHKKNLVQWARDKQEILGRDPDYGIPCYAIVRKQHSVTKCFAKY